MKDLSRTLRKRIINTTSVPAPSPGQAAIDIPAVATVIITSEDPSHPIENIFSNDDQTGTHRWVAANPGEQYVILDFDTPQTIRRINLAIEETEIQRTQELTIAISSDHGKTYQELIRQEYNFSPPETTWERETWQVSADRVCQLRLHITPDKSRKPCRATVTSLILY